MRPVHETIVNRHRNPFGIFLRIPNTVLFGFGLWFHLPVIITIGVLVELSLWLVIPPVEKSLPFIDKVIEEELRWLSAPCGILKWFSFLILAVAVVIVFTGLWCHVFAYIPAGIICLLLFRFLMSLIASFSS